MNDAILKDLKNRQKLLQSYHDKQLGEKDSLEKMNKDKNKELQKNKDEILLKTEVNSFLEAISKSERERVKTSLEDACTSSLQHISQAKYRCEIKLDKSRGKPSAEIYIVENINGVDSYQLPEDVCGGSFVNTLSTVLQFEYVQLYSKPFIRGPVLFDEPGNMVAKELSSRFAEIIQSLSKDNDRQSIVSTHAVPTINIADNVVIVEKKNGQSKVRKYDPKSSSTLIKNLMNGGNKNKTV